MTRQFLEQLSDRSMPGRERHLIGDWICRAANGVTGRANSCSPIGSPRGSIEQGIDEVEAWFVGRGLRPLFQLWEGCPSELVAELDRRGYATGEGAEVLTLELRSAEPIVHSDESRFDPNLPRFVKKLRHQLASSRSKSPNSVLV